MHPAFSVIVFTTASGAGYGLMALLAVRALWLPSGAASMADLVALLLAFALIAGGLLSSTLHLGQPKRAWRAFSQWRSSWLSREGVVAVLTFLPLLLLMLHAWRGGDPGRLRVVAALALAGAAVTVYCTAQIYASLKTIRAWRSWYTAPVYLVLAAWSGAVLLWLLDSLGGTARVPRAVLAVLTVVALGLKLAYWRWLDHGAHKATPESATGLGRFGRVHQFEAPHTEENYLLKEMGYKVARKHAERLRLLCLQGFGLVALALVAARVAPAAEPWCAGVAMIATAGTLLVERWLFFAQARHVVTLYYGEQRA